MRAACLALPFVLSAALPAQAGPLLPHRAVYDLALENASDRSGITGIVGRMVSEFHGADFDVYTVKFRIVTQIDTPVITRITHQPPTTFEDGGGKTFIFAPRSFVDSVMVKEVRVS